MLRDAIINVLQDMGICIGPRIDGCCDAAPPSLCCNASANAAPQTGINACSGAAKPSCCSAAPKSAEKCASGDGNSCQESTGQVPPPAKTSSPVAGGCGGCPSSDASLKVVPSSSPPCAPKASVEAVAGPDLVLTPTPLDLSISSPVSRRSSSSEISSSDFSEILAPSRRTGEAARPVSGPVFLGI